MVHSRNISKQMKFKPLQLLSHVVLILGVLLMVLPIWFSFATSTHDNISIIKEGMQFFLGDSFSVNYNEVLNEKGGWSEEVTAFNMFINSFITVSYTHLRAHET